MKTHACCILAVAVIATGCNTREAMVGAGAEVTGGRIFRFVPIDVPEQQQLMELQSLSAQPGQIIRAGGFGRHATGFLVEFGETTKWRVEEYCSNVTSLQLGTIMTKLAVVDAAAAKVVQVTMRLANARQHVAEAKDATKTAAETKDASERADINAVIKDVLQRGDSVTDVQAATQAVSAPTEALNDAKARLTPAQAAVTSAENALISAMTLLTDEQGELQKELAKHVNVWIFRARDTRTSSSSITAGDLGSVSGSRESAESVLVVLAGLRRMRLVVGASDFDDYYKTIDPTGRLMRWPASYRTSGPVTHVLQVQRLRYFTEGHRRWAIEAMVKLTPEYFTQLSAADFLELQIDLRIAVEAFSSYENQGSFGDPIVTTYHPFDPYADPPDSKWMTLTATTTQLNYLRKQGRITK